MLMYFFFFLQQADLSFQPLTEVKFHVPGAVIPAIYKRRRPVMGASCDRCCKESKVMAVDRVGLRLLI